MQKELFLKPAPGLTIRDAANKGQVLPPEGKVVTLTPYWTRRLKEGDVVLASAPKTKGGK
jgi:hypothetical protein